MTPYLIGAVFFTGVAAGGLPVRMYYEAKEDHRAKVEAEAALEQEKRNVEIVTHYQDLIAGVSDWYRSNPVRVRIQGNKECPRGFDADPGSVTVTVGGVKRDNRPPVGE